MEPKHINVSVSNSSNLLGCIGANFANLLMFQYHQFVGMWGQQIIEHDVQS
jgi:hypothetical protein